VHQQRKESFEQNLVLLFLRDLKHGDDRAKFKPGINLWFTQSNNTVIDYWLKQPLEFSYIDPSRDPRVVASNHADRHLYPQPPGRLHKRQKPDNSETCPELLFQDPVPSSENIRLHPVPNGNQNSRAGLYGNQGASVVQRSALRDDLRDQRAIGEPMGSVVRGMKESIDISAPSRNLNAEPDMRIDHRDPRIHVDGKRDGIGERGNAHVARSIEERAAGCGGGSGSKRERNQRSTAGSKRRSSSGDYPQRAGSV